MQLHCLGAQQDRKQHPYLLPCRLCQDKLFVNLADSFVCCLGTLLFELID